MAILEVDDIHTYYGDAYVLQGLSLQLQQGQILGLSDATASARRPGQFDRGIHPAAPGQDIFKGVDITEVSSFETVRSGMGLVPQGGASSRP